MIYTPLQFQSLYIYSLLLSCCLATQKNHSTKGLWVIPLSEVRSDANLWKWHIKGEKGRCWRTAIEN